MEEANELISQATSYSYLNEYETALKLLQEAHEIVLEVTRNRSATELARVYLKLAKVHEALGNEA